MFASVPGQSPGIHPTPTEYFGKWDEGASRVAGSQAILGGRIRFVFALQIK